MKGETDLKPPLMLEGEKLVAWSLEKGKEITMRIEKLPKVLPPSPNNHFLRRIGENFWMHTISPF